MKFFPGRKRRTGFEITADQVKSARIVDRSDGPAICELIDVPLLPDVIKPSFKKENIFDLNAFGLALKKCCKNTGSATAGIALPDTCIKVVVKTFPELPGDPDQTHEMIVWDITTSLNLSEDELRISWKPMGKNLAGSFVFLIAMAMEPVMVQYEAAFQQAGIRPKTISPAGLAQFDFYSQKIPEDGNVAFLGMFDEFVNLFVFLDGSPVFYKTIKKGLLSGHSGSAINDADLLIQYYNAEHPDFAIERFYIASHIKSGAQVGQVLTDIENLEFHILEEKQLIGFDKKFVSRPEHNPLHFYTSAIGAAQGI